MRNSCITRFFENIPFRFTKSKNNEVFHILYSFCFTLEANTENAFDKHYVKVGYTEITKRNSLQRRFYKHLKTLKIHNLKILGLVKYTTMNENGRCGETELLQLLNNQHKNCRVELSYKVGKMVHKTREVFLAKQEILENIHTFIVSRVPNEYFINSQFVYYYRPSYSPPSSSPPLSSPPLSLPLPSPPTSPSLSTDTDITTDDENEPPEWRKRRYKKYLKYIKNKREKLIIQKRNAMTTYNQDVLDHHHM